MSATRPAKSLMANLPIGFDERGTRQWLWQRVAQIGACASCARGRNRSRNNGQQNCSPESCPTFRILRSGSTCLPASPRHSPQACALETGWGSLVSSGGGASQQCRELCGAREARP